MLFDVDQVVVPGQSVERDVADRVLVAAAKPFDGAARRARAASVICVSESTEATMPVEPSVVFLTGMPAETPLVTNVAAESNSAVPPESSVVTVPPATAHRGADGSVATSVPLKQASPKP